ncbi:transposable element Tc1 transposase [Trichonephila inaurata madagascariensis]|uniref:Transposable element Tc1 transposase n=1 Tax=Trichonephila inaurata madagascariensis TaxID=2747483 RepID=A0A8X6IRL8_9ARAC|nr:transposable element Tc1 transposase [Trichonephila inaurata madagascariensis]GFY43015.1 transposable element Tc1 transposase [Trichonephila inaurata madagascariensis]
MIRDSDKKDKDVEVKTESNNEATLRAKRTNLRRLITVAANSFDDIHRSMNNEKNIDIQFSKVCEKAERLFKVDQEIQEITNFSDEEYDTMESYWDRFAEIRVIYEKNYNKHTHMMKINLKSQRLCPDVSKENPTSPKDKVNNAKKKTSWITSELKSEEIQKARLAVIGIVVSSNCILAKNGIERVAKLRAANGFVIRPLQWLYPLKMPVSNLPSDRALGENFPEPNKDSDRLKSTEVPGSNLPAPNPVPKVSRPVKQIRCGQRITERLNL